MSNLKNILLESEEYSKIIDNLQLNRSPISLVGTIDRYIPHLAYTLCSDSPIIVVERNELRAKMVYEDILGLGEEQVYHLPKRELFYFSALSGSTENTITRLKTIDAIINNRAKIIVTTMEAMSDKYMNPKYFNNHRISLKMGEEVEINTLLSSLVTMGYESNHQVEGPGQFSHRGGIIDIYSTDTRPYRIEFFDNEVDSIRVFDPLTQRSLEVLDSIEISPVEEFILPMEIREQIINGIEEELKSSNLSGDARKNSEDKFREVIENLKNGTRIRNRDLIIPYIPQEYLSHWSRYLDGELIFLLNEPVELVEGIEGVESLRETEVAELLSKGEILKSHSNIKLDSSTIFKIFLENKTVLGNSLNRRSPKLMPKVEINFSVVHTTNYRGKIDLFYEDLKSYLKRDYRILILSGDEKRTARLHEQLQEEELSSRLINHDEEVQVGINILRGGLKGGFEIPSLKFVLINHSEIYGKKSKKKQSKKKSLNFEDLNIGDYVVHENHGIGVYEGTKRMEVKGVLKDYISIKYSGEDKLFLPIESLSQINKFIGDGNKSPKVNKLNSVEWSRTKSKAKKSVEDMAEDLIKLYAKRENARGFAFSADGEWQMEFEDAFQFEETDGQLQAIEEIKEDMESLKPMDRLLCADVGYGKTEVALRAAFKAVLDGKQVAFLVPTTILAQQHYNTMVERFKDFPVNIGVFSRFRTSKEQKEDLKKLKSGNLDIVVGTHRLLSKDVEFKDLGLLIVDEEQRFGVRHKEKLKMMKENVDTLTLTATPIPRTLQMSMVGIRDMSVIGEPPEDRFPIQTYVLEYKDSLVREAILKELNRGGQVYFVYNRVASMEEKLIRLRNLVPEARIDMANGQMSESQLESTMVKFINQEIDVLLCSTIIETGMDVSNANTMIITDSNRLGLSQLYQLRGRIGRSNRIAYCHLTYDKDVSLTEIAQKRLKAIKEFTEFGSGQKIAMRDLEIRGSGNILGARQHGHMDAIGYDLYIKYLREAVSKLKGEEIKEEVQTSIDLKLDSFIPVKYVENNEQRLEIYKKIAVISSDEDYSDLIDELIDRFGEIPKSVSNLMDIALLKSIASKKDVLEIAQVGEKYRIDLLKGTLNPELINNIKAGTDLKFDFKFGGVDRLLFNNLKYPIDDIKNVLNNIGTNTN